MSGIHSVNFSSVQSAEVLLVDDDTILLKRATHALEGEGFICRQASTIEQMRVALAARSVDAIVMDLGLPDADGMTQIEKIVETHGVPLIVLTSRDGIEDRLQALGLGADDFITKPCDLRELVARVTAVIRRAQRVAQPVSSAVPFAIGGWSVDAAQNSLSADGALISLSSKEFELLMVLAQNAPKTLTRKWLMFAVHQREWVPEDRTIDNLVSRLRKKLRPLDETSKIIEANRLHGYRLVLPVQIA